MIPEANSSAPIDMKNVKRIFRMAKWEVEFRRHITALHNNTLFKEAFEAQQPDDCLGCFSECRAKERDLLHEELQKRLIGIGFLKPPCNVCGESKDHACHVQHGNDLENPVKHTYVPQK